jgi:hypothetical protein
MHIFWPDVVYTAYYFREHRNLVKTLSKLRKAKKQQPLGVLNDYCREQSRVWLVLESAIKTLRRRNSDGQSPARIFMLP